MTEGEVTEREKDAEKKIYLCLLLRGALVYICNSVSDLLSAKNVKTHLL